MKELFTKEQRERKSKIKSIQFNFGLKLSCI